MDSLLGEVVFEYSPAPDRRLALFQGGFRGLQNGQEIVARWEDIAFIKRSHVRVLIVGIARDTVRAQIQLTDGRMYVLEGHDEGAILASRHLAALSAPVLTARMMAQLQAPGGATFGANVRATPGGLHFRKGSKWRTLRFDSIAGYKVFQGHCLIDDNPTSPRLAEQIALASLQNPDAFLLLLSVMAPDKDLDEKPYPFSVGFFATSAATHDPRYLSMRARGIGCLALVGAGALAGLVVLIVNAYYSRQYQQAAEDYQARLKKYQTALDSRVKDLAQAPAPTASLRDACAGKGVKTTSLTAVVTGAEAGATGLLKEPMPWYSQDGFDGFELPRQRLEYTKDVTLLVRILTGTALGDKASPRARLHVQVYRDPAEAPVCEGLAEGRWRVDSFSLMDEQERREGLLTTVVMGLCAPTSSDPVCGRMKKPLYVKDLAEGPPPAPSASATAAPKGKAPPKKR